MPVLVTLTGVSLALLALRVPLSGGSAHGFLVWNTFLAWLPIVFAWAALEAHARGARIVTVCAGAAWLSCSRTPPTWSRISSTSSCGPPRGSSTTGCSSGSFAVLGLLLGGAALRPVHRRVDGRFGVRGSLPLLATMGS
jgi:hypothetical protein